MKPVGSVRQKLLLRLFWPLDSLSLKSLLVKRFDGYKYLSPDRYLPDKLLSLLLSLFDSMGTLPCVRISNKLHRGRTRRKLRGTSLRHSGGFRNKRVSGVSYARASSRKRAVSSTRASGIRSSSSSRGPSSRRSSIWNRFGIIVFSTRILHFLFYFMFIFKL